MRGGTGNGPKGAAPVPFPKAVYQISDAEAGTKTVEISDHQQSWGYEDGPWKGPGPPLLVAADF
jgi:hypothetical protein